MFSSPREVKEEEEVDEKPDLNELNVRIAAATAGVQCEADYSHGSNAVSQPITTTSYHCPYCIKRVFSTNDELIYHYQKCPDFVASLDWASNPLTACYYTMGYSVYCPIPECGKLCPTFFYLSAHLLNHRETGNFFKCNACRFVYRNAHHLKEHLIRESKLPSKYARCHNSATVIEKREADDLFQNRMGPGMSYAVCSRVRSQPSVGFPQLTGCSGTLKLQPKTLRDAEDMECTRSLFDARLKVRNYIWLRAPVGSLAVPRRSSLNWAPEVMKPEAAPAGSDPPTPSTGRPISRKRQLRNDPGIFSELKEAASEDPSCSTREEWEENALQKYESTIHCPYCLHDQKGLELLAAHVSARHPAHARSLIFCCAGCSCRFTRPADLKTHLLSQAVHGRRYCTNTAAVLVRSPVAGKKPMRLEEYVRLHAPEEEEEGVMMFMDNRLLKEEEEGMLLRKTEIKEEVEEAVWNQANDLFDRRIVKRECWQSDE